MSPAGVLAIIDGKVIALSERDSTPTFLVRFTGIGWTMQERIEALAQRGAKEGGAS